MTLLFWSVRGRMVYAQKLMYLCWVSASKKFEISTIFFGFEFTRKAWNKLPWWIRLLTDKKAFHKTFSSIISKAPSFTWFTNSSAKKWLLSKKATTFTQRWITWLSIISIGRKYTKPLGWRLNPFLEQFLLVENMLQ